MLNVTKQIKWMFLVLAILGFASVSVSADEPEGQALFLKEKCNTCHAVESAGIEAKRDPKGAPDMSNIGAEIPSAEWAMKYVMREERKDGKKHRRPYKGSEKDLQKIVGWLLTLKSS